jgi:hypothetical protein
MRSSASSSSRGVKYRTLSDLIRSPSGSSYCFKSDYKNIIISMGDFSIMLILNEWIERCTALIELFFAEPRFNR